MGEPSQYDDEIEQEETQEDQQKEEDILKGKRKRIFRNLEERMIGGVGSDRSSYVFLDHSLEDLIYNQIKRKKYVGL